MERRYSGNCNIVATKRWICFIAAIWLQSINGTNFVFSNYSSTLKDVMGMNQIKLNSLAVASDLGKIMGWVSGVMCMFLPSWAVLGIAMTLGLLGYGGQWLILTEIIPPLEYWQVYVLCFLAGNSLCWFNTVSFMTAIEIFPINRAIASGLTTSYSGLSAVIYTCLFSMVDPGNPSLYLLLNCIVPAIVGTVSAFLLHVSQSKVPNEEKADKMYIIIVTVIAIVTAVYSILFGFLPHAKRGKEAIYMSVLIVLLVAPLYIPLKLAFGHRTKSKRVISCSSSPRVSPNNIPEIKQNPIEEEISSMKTLSTTEEIPEETKHYTALDIEQEKQTTERFETSQLKSAPSLGEEHGIRELLTSIDFWLYYGVEEGRHLCIGKQCFQKTFFPVGRCVLVWNSSVRDSVAREHVNSMNPSTDDSKLGIDRNTDRMYVNNFSFVRVHTNLNSKTPSIHNFVSSIKIL